MAHRDTELLSIGQMAQVEGISAKALRYYERIGILSPTAVNEETGYRYYAPEQILDIDAIRICLAAGIPLERLADHRGQDGALDWRSILLASRARVQEEISRLQRLEIGLSDYLDEYVRKAHSPEDGTVTSIFEPTHLVALPWDLEDAFDMRLYLQTMRELRDELERADAPKLLRRGIAYDRAEQQAYAYLQFSPVTPDGNPVAIDPAFRVFAPQGGAAESLAIERPSLRDCFSDALEMARSEDTGTWEHITMTEIWGGRSATGAARIRFSRHRCALAEGLG